MNERYLFRGKTVDGVRPHFVIGHYVSIPRPMIVSDKPKIGGGWDFDDVDPDTVGQCTGLCDKNGKLIFEGDIIGNLKPHGTFNPTVQFHDGAFWLADFHLSCCAEKAIIVGNIHNNPDLLKS